MIKQNQEVTVERSEGKKKTYRIDILNVKDFYLKIKIANIRKNLHENESINKELCLDPDT